MSGHYTLIAHRQPTEDELLAVFDLIREDLNFKEFGPGAEETLPHGMFYHIGFPPDEDPDQTFQAADDGHTVQAWGFIADDEPNGFGEQLFGWGHDHKITCQDA